MKVNNFEWNTIELTTPDLDCAADLLAVAFYDNPSHIYIFPDNHNRLKAIRWMLRCNLNLNLNTQKYIGQSFALVEPNQPPGVRKIKAMAFWNPPKSPPVSFLSMVKEGLLTMPFRFGWGSFPRLLEVLKGIDAAKQQTLHNCPAWYLNNMVVSSELRGMGVGTKILGEQLQKVVEPSGFPAILMTQKEANVRFYQRLGFEVASKSIIGKEKNAFINWCLSYQPKILF